MMYVRTHGIRKMCWNVNICDKRFASNYQWTYSHIQWSELDAREKEEKKGPIQLWCLSNWLNKINEGWYLTHIMHAIAMTKIQQYSFALCWTNQYWKAIIQWAFIPNNEVVELSILYSRKPHKCRNIAAQHESINTNEQTNERTHEGKRIHIFRLTRCFQCALFLFWLNILGLFSLFIMVSNDTFI